MTTFKKGDVIIPRDNKYPNGALEVDEVGDVLRAHPLGGGVRLRFDGLACAKYGFRLVSKDEQVAAQTTWTPGWYFIGDVNPCWPGWDNGWKWNGWACPAFAEEATKKFLSDPDRGFTWQKFNDKFYYTFEGVEEPVVLEPSHVYGVKEPVYQFDGFVWERLRRRFAVGDRVRLARKVGEYPLRPVPKGSLGTVVLDDWEQLSVKMDDHFEDLDEWDNELHWDGPLVTDRFVSENVDEDLELVSEDEEKHDVEPTRELQMGED